MRIANAALAEHGMRMSLLSDDDRPASDNFLRALRRGFFHDEPTSLQLDLWSRNPLKQRRVAVYDPTAAEPALPVGTIDTWPMDLSLPGGAVTTRAISAVTVAPTHRRLGIARAMVTEELRSAVAAGFPLASLTVTEATIYRRFGFGPAAMAADLEIDTRRAGWAGPTAAGRVHFVTRDQALELSDTVLATATAGTPGDVVVYSDLAERIFGASYEPAKLASLRFIRYDDENGTAAGFACYRTVENDSDPGTSRLELSYLCAVTPDAYAGLWKFLIEMDLIATIQAPLRRIDEPLRWMLADPRGMRTMAVSDHHWLRVLDPMAVLQARSYRTAGTLVIGIDDELGHAHGSWQLDVADDLKALVTPTDLTADVRMDVSDFGSILLGGVSVQSLSDAGRITSTSQDATLWLDSTLSTERAPWLSTWY